MNDEGGMMNRKQFFRFIIPPSSFTISSELLDVYHRLDSQRGSVHGAEPQAALTDHQGRPAVSARVVQVAVGIEYLPLDARGEHRQAGKVVMPVALDAADSQGGTDSQILQEGDRADVRQVLPAGDEPARRLLLAQVGEQAGVDEALENALAVLVAGAVVAESQRPRQAVQLRVGLVDDQRRPILPVAQWREHL